MKKRSPVAVAALSIVTFGVYAYYWLYATTDELRRETGREGLSPVVDVILTLMTFGLWGVWAGYRNAQIAHEELEAQGDKHADRSLPVAAFAAVGVFSVWAWPVAIALLQEDLNRLVELDAAQHRFDAAVPYEAPRGAASQVRVELDPVEAPAVGQPASCWERAPSAPVFESSAPMPVVY